MARTTWYAQDLTGTTTTTIGGWDDALTLTHTPNDNTAVAYIVSFSMSGTSASADVLARFHRDTDSVVENEWIFEFKDSTDVFAITGIAVVSYGSSPGSKTVSIEIGRESGFITPAVSNLRIWAIELGANDKYSSGTATEDDTTSTTLSDVTSSGVTFTPSTTGDYLILGTIEYHYSITSRQAHYTVVVDGSAEYENKVANSDATTQGLPVAYCRRKNLDNSSHTIKWQHKVKLSGTASARRGRILALRWDDFDAGYYAEDRAGGSGTDTTYQTECSLNPNIAENVKHVVIGGWSKTNDDTGAQADARFYDGTTTFGEGSNEAANSESGDPAHFAGFIAYEATLSTGTGVTWTLDRKHEDTGGTTGLIETAIAILQVEDAATGHTSTGAQTLGQITQAGSAGQEFTATAAQTLGGISSAGAGTHVENLSGTAALNIGPITNAATAGLTFTATAAQTLGLVVGAGVGVETFPSTGAVTLGEVTQAGVGVEAPAAAGAQTLDGIVSVGAATLSIPSTGALTLPGITQAASAYEHPDGAGAQALGQITQLGQAAVASFIATSAMDLPQITVSGAAVEIIDASAAQTLGGIVQAGASELTITATGTLTLGNIAQAGTATLEIDATAALTLQQITMDGAGEQPAQGAGAQTLSQVTMETVGAFIITAQGVQTLPNLRQAGEAVAFFAPTASGSMTLGQITMAGVVFSGFDLIWSPVDGQDGDWSEVAAATATWAAASAASGVWSPTTQSSNIWSSVPGADGSWS